MVSLGRPLALLSIVRSTSAFLVVTRRVSFYGIVAASSLVNQPPQIPVASSSSAHDHSQQRRNMQTTDAAAAAASSMTGYLNAQDAAALDAELMSTPGFSLEQLMELAGLSVAEAVYQVVVGGGSSTTTSSSKPKILLVCGPGNNGGDGLVAARHLVMFGFDCVVVYPKRSSKQHFVNLIQQCEDVGISVLDDLPEDLDSYSAVVDSIFGFSFKGEAREPFKSILLKLKQVQDTTTIVSVDIPSGWNVDTGDEANTGFRPAVLISLTVPKFSAREFQGRHFVGGRFLPPFLAEKYGVKMPPYPGVSQVMELSSVGKQKDGFSEL